MLALEIRHFESEVQRQGGKCATRLTMAFVGQKPLGKTFGTSIVSWRQERRRELPGCVCGCKKEAEVCLRMGL